MCHSMINKMPVKSSLMILSHNIISCQLDQDQFLAVIDDIFDAVEHPTQYVGNHMMWTHWVLITWGYVSLCQVSHSSNYRNNRVVNLTTVY